MRRPYSPLSPEQQAAYRDLAIGRTIYPHPLTETSVYVHIPFCSSRCRYCDFYFETGWSPAVLNRTLARIIEEAAFFMQHCSTPKVRTLYIGGGTPSVIPPSLLEDFLGKLSAVLQLDPHTCSEWSFEANPENITPELLQVLKKAGVTRLSIGIQSFSDHLLRTLTRRAYSSSISSALQLVSRNWTSADHTYSIDLISGIPGQTAADITLDLQQLQRWQPDHVSHYTLTVEPQTPLHQMIERGDLKLPEQDSLWEQLHLGLQQSGYEHYEISNYARDKRYSRHNIAYWQMRPYIGLGPGAVGTIPLTDHDGIGFPGRLTNPDLFHYSAPSCPSWRHEIEPLNPADMFTDYCITGLRTIWGISRRDLIASFGSGVLEILQEFMHGQEDLFESDDQDAIRCTARGRLLLNQVIRHGLGNIAASPHRSLPDRIHWPPVQTAAG
ncbi:radical SAM family heme chaperone HemW [Spirochaeta africana]|uniref:Heme chaperone HemW n=1 Tax=Spirochaeta africana (strain ATCC 700263 / DSM 8902 / Z-7692) TaxID=889378 RepID=H9UIA8_SPIAZ|nr:radical SAM family heme chaperone HemW [Spirochaeta africana]AFG37251.1 putative oxygen-independent coproporphyrinogen III oxidase [Spirochaeta africana DSM 8902]